MVSFLGFRGFSNPKAFSKGHEADGSSVNFERVIVDMKINFCYCYSKDPEPPMKFLYE